VQLNTGAQIIFGDLTPYLTYAPCIPPLWDTLSLFLLYPYMYSVDGAVKGGGWVEEIKKFLNMKIKKFPRNSGGNLPNFHEAEFYVISRNSDQFRIAYVCMKIKQFLC
jgi:hypothetical protein